MIDEPLHIGIHRFKTILLILGSIAFSVIGAYMIYRNRDMDGLNETILCIMGVVGILFFGGLGIPINARNLMRTAAYTLDDQGLTNHLVEGSLHFIPWKDIRSFKIQKVERTKLIIVYLRNPNEYTAELTGIKKLLARWSQNYSGSPVALATTNARCSSQQLLDHLNDYLNRYRASSKKQI